MMTTTMLAGVLLALTTAGGLKITPGTDRATIAWRSSGIDLAPDPASDYAGPGVAARLEVPGLQPIVSPGAPALPGRTVLLALPPGAVAELEWSSAQFHIEDEVWIAPSASTPVAESLEENARPRFRAEMDPQLYSTDAWWPAEPVQILSRGIARDTDYALVQVVPFQWNPVQRKLKVFDELEVALRFGPSGAAAAAPGEAAGEPAGGGRERGRTAVRPRASGTFANGDPPAAWQLRRKSPDLPRILTALNPAASTEGWKIEVDRDGIHRVTQAELIAAGLPADTDVGQLHLQLDGKSIPLRVIDRDADGLLDPGDELWFFGVKNARRFTDTNVYWLTRSGGGAWMGEVPAFPPAALGYPALPSYLARTRSEKNETYHSPSPHDPAVADPWIYSVTRAVKHAGPNCSICTPASGETTCPFVDDTLVLPALAPAEPGQSYMVRGRMIARRLYLNCANNSHSVRVLVNKVPVGTVQWTILPGYEATFAFPVDLSLLVAPPGRNEVRLESDGTIPGAHWIYVDFVELESPARLAAKADVLDARGAWNSGHALYVSGFSSTDLEFLDVRGDGTVLRLVGPRLLSLGPGSPWTAAVSLEPSSPGLTRRVFATRRANLQSVRSIVKDTPSSLASTGNDALHVAVAHASFLSSTRALSDWRTLNGIKSLTVDVQDVFDEFSWGNVDPQAIHDFMAYAFSSWQTAPLYLLIVGDTSFDYKNFFGVSAPGYPPASYVPYREYMSVVPSSTEKILASDFSFQEVTGDALPDLLVGRLAVRTSGEVDTYVEKLKRYEPQSPTQTWAGRVMFVVDDDIHDERACPPAIKEAEQHVEDLIATYLPGIPARVVNREIRDFGSDTALANSTIVGDRNAGVTTFFYFGHGSIFSLGRVCTNPPPFFFEANDVAKLTHQTALPISTTVACNDGAFNFVSAPPNVITRCYGETMTFTRPVGDIAYIGSTTEISVASGKGQLEGMMDGLFAASSAYLPAFVADARRRAGGIHYAAQMGFFLNPRSSSLDHQDDQHTCVLLGDPAASLVIQDP